MRDNLEDDSVRAERYTLELERDGDVWTLVSARRDQRCHTKPRARGLLAHLRLAILRSRI